MAIIAESGARTKVGQENAEACSRESGQPNRENEKLEPLVNSRSGCCLSNRNKEQHSNESG